MGASSYALGKEQELWARSRCGQASAVCDTLLTSSLQRFSSIHGENANLYRPFFNFHTSSADRRLGRGLVEQSVRKRLNGKD